MTTLMNSRNLCFFESKVLGYVIESFGFLIIYFQTIVDCLKSSIKRRSVSRSSKNVSKQLKRNKKINILSTNQNSFLKTISMIAKNKWCHFLSRNFDLKNFPRLLKKDKSTYHSQFGNSVTSLYIIQINYLRTFH